MHGVAKQQFETKSHAARGTAHATWQIDEKRMFGIDRDRCSIELSLETLRCDGIA